MLFKRLYTRWVPKNLTPKQKNQRLGSVLSFLQWYHDDSDKFIDRIVMANKTWISHFTPETKQKKSMHWRLSSGECFDNDEELKTSVVRWFHSQPAQFYDRGIQI
ncbi:hypothetical protein TNCV_136801 [Trichonephila clavipes]|nr:hypothetical protein TNCV_136801 [Trichonephila clavipes]